jgi:hypothetical protein
MGFAYPPFLILSVPARNRACTTETSESPPDTRRPHHSFRRQAGISSATPINEPLNLSRDIDPRTNLTGDGRSK